MTVASSVEQLSGSLRGQLIQPSDPEYDEARKVYNAMHDRRPAVVVRCADVADVINAVKFARENRLSLAIRGGGHNVAGFGTVDEGIVIDLSGMRGVRVDPAKRTVRAEGGCTWGDVDHASHAFGLAVPCGIVSTTGVAGLTLGGGTGYLTRKYGLTVDNLISVDVVTADGSLVTANVEENEDLFWAIRGGGGNFGVVTSFEFRAHPVSEIYGGPIFYPIEKTKDVLRFFREYIAEAPPEMGAFFAFQKGPPVPFMPDNLVDVTMCAIVACYAGEDLKKGEQVVKPLLEELGPPAALHVDRMPLPALNSMFDPLLPPGLQHYWKGDFFDELSDEAIDAHLKHGPDVPTVQATMHVYPIDGAPQRVGQEETAFSYRDAAFNVVVVGVWPDAADNEKNTKWVRDYFEALHPHSSGGAYVNFMTADEGQDRIKASYRENYDRLVAVKNKYDPTNLFHINQNIEPTV